MAPKKASKKVPHPDFPCGVCSLATKGTASIGCGVCNQWFHARCQDLDVDLLAQWTTVSDEYVCLRCRSLPDGRFDYRTGLDRIKQAADEGYKKLVAVAKRELMLCGRATMSIESIESVHNYDNLLTDKTALALMRRHGIDGRPLATLGDGNCLFNAVSLTLQGTFELAPEMRYKTCLQMALNKSRVLQGHHNLKDIYIVSSKYTDAVVDCARDHAYSSPWTILGLSQVVHRNVLTLYPPENSFTDQVIDILSTVFGNFAEDLPLTILWTGPKKRPQKTWLPNHYIPIVPEHRGNADDSAHDSDVNELATEDSDGDFVTRAQENNET